MPDQLDYETPQPTAEFPSRPGVGFAVFLCPVVGAGCGGWWGTATGGDPLALFVVGWAAAGGLAGLIAGGVACMLIDRLRLARRRDE
jgi:predicted phage tail protein